jgi:hypothetical protein
MIKHVKKWEKATNKNYTLGSTDTGVNRQRP